MSYDWIRHFCQYIFLLSKRMVHLLTDCLLDFGNKGQLILICGGERSVSTQKTTPRMRRHWHSEGRNSIPVWLPWLRSISESLCSTCLQLLTWPPAHAHPLRQWWQFLPPMWETRLSSLGWHWHMRRKPANDGTISVSFSNKYLFLIKECRNLNIFYIHLSLHYPSKNESKITSKFWGTPQMYRNW